MANSYYQKIQRKTPKIKHAKNTKKFLQKNKTKGERKPEKEIKILLKK